MDNDGKGRPELDWLKSELRDSLDEETELELEDSALSLEIAQDLQGAGTRHQIEREDYFRELLRLQSELIKLQDWVAYHTRRRWS